MKLYNYTTCRSVTQSSQPSFRQISAVTARTPDTKLWISQENAPSHGRWYLREMSIRQESRSTPSRWLDRAGRDTERGPSLRALSQLQ